MTTLSDIRDLETRLHSHVLEWDDRPLLDELLYLLDELQYIHDDLDMSDIPSTGTDNLDLTLRQRVACLAGAHHSLQATREYSVDFYNKIQDPIPTQIRMF
jgi:hypothetical protein